MNLRDVEPMKPSICKKCIVKERNECPVDANFCWRFDQMTTDKFNELKEQV